MGELIARRPSEVLIEALGECYAQMDGKEPRAWLAGPALHSKHEAVVRAALDAQFVHGDEAAYERIMELYINTVHWGPHIYGVNEAAGTYFSRAPADLTGRASSGDRPAGTGGTG